MVKTDGHVHTPFCPHGTNDSFEQYIEHALDEQFSSLTFTEHAPLPEGFQDPTPDQDSAMKLEDMEEYIRQLQSLRNKYRNKITINIGLEVDYIRGFENETELFLNKYGKYIDDSILSVHFLKLDESFYCMDFDVDTFRVMIEKAGSLENLHHIYYQEVMNSITSNLGVYKPKRIGHITLVNKFQKKFPPTFSTKNEVINILKAIKKHNLELDFNVAGLRKEFCGEIYPGEWVIESAKKQKIPLIYGSDAHSARDIGKNYTQYDQLAYGN